jgi:hypothetical protein
MIVKTLLRKHKAASNGVESMKFPFEELSSTLDPKKLKLWTKKAKKADNERGEALDIYSLQMDKGCLSFIIIIKVLLLILSPLA